MRKIAVIPTLLTLGNAVCGFAAIACAAKIDWEKPGTEVNFAYSGWLIIAAMVFDGLDGYVARLSKSMSKFGAELDSLCDAISFGAAPGFLLLRLGPGWQTPFQHQALAGIATLYMVCAILRLARYNVETTVDPSSGKRFRGLPSPGAAGCVASLGILRHYLIEDFSTALPLLERGAMVGSLFVALLMVSRVPFPHVTKQVFSGRMKFSSLIQVVVVLFVILMLPQVALAVLFWGYALVIPARYALIRNLRQRPQPMAGPSGLEDTLPH